MIDLDCVCGKRYTVPDEKAGRKLQCRRCGAIQRIPRRDTDPLIVQFQVPDDDDDDGAPLGFKDDDHLRAPAPPPLDIKDPVRRCPSCGFNDDASVVVCVRCGYDHRAGKRLSDAHDARALSDRRRQVDVASVQGAGLETLGWLCLSPLGVVLGPWVVARGLALERAVGASGAEAERLARTRARALGGFFLWTLVLGVVVLAVRRATPSSRSDDRACRERLDAVGRAVRDRVLADRRFPPADTPWPAALERLGANLACPLGGGDLYRYRRRDAELLTAETAPDYLLAWDREPHPDDRGTLVFRALRFDGAVEAFSSRADLAGAVGRPTFAGLAVPPGPATTTAPQPQPRPGAGQGPAPPARLPRVQGFLALAASLDDRDPDLLSEQPVDGALFIERAGVPPAELMPVLVREADPEVRVHAARMLARLDLPRADKREMARGLATDPDPAVRFGAAMALRRVGEASWLAVLVSATDDRAADIRETALRWLAREASRGRAQTRELLQLAAGQRERLGARGDGPMFPLPQDALVHAVDLVVDGDPKVRREARAALLGADLAGADAIARLFESPDRAQREAAFAVLDQLRAANVVPLERYLSQASAELDPELRASALAGLATARGEPPAPLLQLALDTLRAAPPAGRLQATCKGVLARAGRAGEGADPAGLTALVEDLARDGDHQAVFAELASPSRLADVRVDAALADAWKRVRDPAARQRMAELLGKRPHEASQRALLAAIDDAQDDVRVAALSGLRDATAVRGDELRRDVARVVGQRLKDEESPRALDVLHDLASGGLYCTQGGDAEEHRCAPALIRALQNQARKGDRAALRTLGTHPTADVVSFLLGLLESNREASRRDEVAAVLREMTRIGASTSDPSAWRPLVEPLSDVTKRHLARMSQEDARRVAERLARGRRRLEELGP